MGFLNSNDKRQFRPDKLAKNNLFETEHMFCDLYCLEPGQEQKVHSHAGATKFYYVLEGTGVFTVGDAERELSPGGVAWSAPGEPHGVRNGSQERLVCLVAMGPNPNG